MSYATYSAANDGAAAAAYGRKAERSRVRDLLARAGQGEGGVLLVDGEPGSGKSLLLREAVDEAAELGFSLAVGAADHLGAAIPFFALQRALGEPLATAAVGRGQQDVAASIGQLRAHLECRAAGTPVLVCLDDLQWASPGTLAALRILPRALRRHPVAWILAWSSVPRGTRSHLLGDLARDGAARVTLGPLERDAATAMLTAAFGAPPGQALTDLADGAGGSPSLITELVGGLRDDDAVHVVGGHAELLSGRLPGRIRHLAERRLDALGKQARHLLMTAAVLGREFRLEDVAEMLGQVPATLLPAAGETMRAMLVTGAEDTFAFRHELLRRAVCELVPEPAARALQRQYGQILLTRDGPAELAARYLLLGAHPADWTSLADLDEAVTRTIGSAPRTAADLAVRALELTSPAGPEVLPRTVAAVEALTAAGRLDRAAEIARDALLRPLPAVAEARVRAALSQALLGGGLAQDAAEQARLALDLPRLPDELRDRALTAHLQALTGLGGESLARAADCALAVHDGHDGHIAAAMVARSVVLWRGGQLGDALELLRAVSCRPAEGGAGARHAPPQLVLGAALIDVRELGEAEEVLLAASRDVPRPGPAGAVLSLLRARVHLAAGRTDEAAADAAAALAVAGEAGAHAYAAAAHAVLSAVELRRGDIMAAGEHLALRSVTGPQFADIYARAECVTAEARLAEARDGALAVVGDLRRLCAGLPADGGLLASDPALPAWLARAALAAGERELAADVARASLALADNHPALPALAAAAAHCQGIVGGDPVRLAEAAERHPDPWARASAAEDLGVLHSREGNAAKAVRHLEDALSGYGEVRAYRDQARVRGRLRQLGIRRRHWTTDPARPLTGWDSLTETEQAVAGLVAQGLSNRDVAGRMYLSVHTVAHYLRQAFRKLGIGSRVELTRIVLEQGQS